MNTQMQMNRRDRGFTLVEIMVVVVILGLLAGVGVVGVRRYLAKAKVDLAAQRCAEIENGIELEETTAGGFDSPEEVLDALIEAKVVKREDTKDPWGTDLIVRYNEDDLEYFVISAGPDKRMDTEDDIGARGPLSEQEER